ncbi:MAG: lamin tail domain-containing protein [Myxococcaceae bacterium]|nr:lamin tail domain-containing protein [Myxococcaceae bacterium]
MTSFRTCAFALALIGLTACPNRPQAPLPAPAPASITAFTVSPSVLTTPGEPVTLEWGTANATDVTIEQVGVGPLDLGASRLSGRLTLPLSRDAIFLMTAQGAGGSDSRATSVSVRRRARAALFSAVPSTIEAGGSATLVWNAPGATAVTLEEVGGPRLDIGAQLESGSARVSPNSTTTYRLTADDKVTTTTVSVAPTVVSFELVGAPPAPGAAVTLRWRTASATSLTLTRVGSASPIMIPAGDVAGGTTTDTVPANSPPDGVLTYVLEARGMGGTASRALEVPVGGGVRITSFAVPSYALTGSTFGVNWTATGGESAELIVDGRRAWQAQSQAEVTSGSYTLSAPTQSTRIELVVRNGRGAEAREARTIEGVGPLAYNFFVADKTSIATPGEAVTLRWSVTNARNVRITSSTGAGFYRQFTGNADSGQLVVLPNGRAGLTRITYRLEADNGTGQAPIARTLDVTLPPAAAAFTFSRQLPVRAPNTVTGTTFGAPTAVAGFKNVEKNPAGEAFIDIRGTGTAVSFGATTNASNVLLPAPFEATLFGTRINGTRLNISRYGWFNLTTSTTAVSGRADNDTQLGAALAPLAVAPYWQNLVVADGQVHWRIDGVADARRLIVQWTRVRPTNGPIDARLTFQAQVHSNGRVVLAYQDFFKVQGAGAVGVVNNSQSDESGPSMPVAAGDVYRLFGPQMLPAPLRIEGTPYAGLALINGDVMEAEGQANYPLNQFLVTEVHYRPATGITNGQWIEIASNADAGVDLGGWDIDFGGVSSWQIPMGTILPPFGRIVVGQASDLGDPAPAAGIALPDGGFEPRVNAAAVYPATFTPPATGGFVRIGIGGNEYTRFPSATGTLSATLPLGRAYGLEDMRSPWVVYDTASTRFFCPAARPVFGQSGQRGSPGLRNASCWMYEAPASSSQAFQSLAGSGTRITYTAVASGIPAADEGLAVLNLPTPIKTYGFETSTITVSSNGFVVPYAFTGCSFFGLFLDACGSNLPDPEPITAEDPPFAIAPFWDDLDGTANMGGATYWRQEPNGDVVVSWENWSIWTLTTGLTTDLNFQVVLRANGDVEYRFGTMTGAGGSGTGTGVLRAAGSSATTWIDIGPAASPININSGVPGIQSNTAYFYELALNRR